MDEVSAPADDFFIDLVDEDGSEILDDNLDEISAGNEATMTRIPGVDAPSTQADPVARLRHVSDPIILYHSVLGSGLESAEADFLSDQGNARESSGDELSGGDAADEKDVNASQKSLDEEDRPLSELVARAEAELSAGGPHPKKGDIPEPVAVGKQAHKPEPVKSKSVSPPLEERALQEEPSGRKRVTKFKPVRRGQRCGKCPSCLNPSWKQACHEVRKRQEVEQGNGGALTANKPVPAAKKAAPAAPSKGSDIDDIFGRDLMRVLGPTQGVTQPKNVALFMDLFKRTTKWAQRVALGMALQKSSDDVKELVIQKKGLLHMQQWLQTAIQNKREATVKTLLSTLDALPVTVQSLMAPCVLARTVGGLRKSQDFSAEVTDAAKKLVAKWKNLSVSADNVKPIASAAAAAAATAATAAAAQAAAAQKAARPVATPSAAAAPKTAPSKPGVGSSTLGDADIFGAAERKRAEAAKSTATPHTPAAPAGAAAKATSKPVSSTSSTTALPGSATAPARPSRPPVAMSRISGASPLDSLLGASLPSSTSLVSPAASEVSQLMSNVVKSGAERARDAAARVPSPEPEPRKEKKKKVAWVADEALQAVRLFRMTDPPSAARADATDADEAAAAPETAEAAPPAEVHPEFASTAKKEHLDEAKALLQHRQEEDRERSELEARMALFTGTVAWYDPPLIGAALNPELGIGRGEESEEVRAAVTRRAHARPAVYATWAQVPPSAEEPPPEDAGKPQHPAYIPRIPLSAEEAQSIAHHAQHGHMGAGHAAQPVYGMQPPMGQAHHGYGVGGHQATPAVQQQQPPAALPDGISAALAQLTASGVLPSLPPVSQQPQQAQQEQQQQYTWSQQHPTGDAGSARQNRGPGARTTYPGGLRPMLGLHRAGQQAQQAPSAQHSGGATYQPPSSGRLRNVPCRFYNTPNGCRNGDRCPFSHADGDGMAGAKRPYGDGGDGGPARKAQRL